MIIGKHIIDEKSKAFIIAELSANHQQNLDIAVATLRAMKESGADAVKLQTYTPDTITLNCDNKYFQIKQGTIWDGETFYHLYQSAYTPWEWHEKLRNVAHELGLVFFSTPFDPTALDLLESLNVPAYKVASFEITDIPLIEAIASKRKPIIISTGIATLNDIELAVQTCRKVGNNQIALLKCTSSYPAPLEEANLKTIPNLKETFDVVVGLSDHTLGSTVPIAAIALGAKIIEKHFILDKKLGGPDSEFSLEPQEFKDMVQHIRMAEVALGKVSYDLSPKIQKSKEFSRSLFVIKDMEEGDIFSDENIRSIRPGFGLHPKYLAEILGKKARYSISRGTPLSWEMIT